MDHAAVADVKELGYMADFRMAVLRSILMWIAGAFLTCAFFCVMLPAALIALPFDRKRNTAHYFARSWARSLLRVNPAYRVTLTGLENLAAIGGNGAAVLCCNHESMVDILALYYLGYPFKWISKREVFLVPLIGQAMMLAGYIPLKRGDKDSIRKCMASAHAWLQRGVSIMMFPEGTRSLDGRLKAFKEGAFRMSIDTGVPVVPVAIHGPRMLLNKGSWLFATRCDIHVIVGPPIRPRESSPAEADRLRTESREWILRTLADLRKADPATIDATQPAKPATAPASLGNARRSAGV